MNFQKRPFAQRCLNNFLMIVMIHLADTAFLRPVFGDPAAASSTSEMDPAIAILKTARDEFKKVRDYDCRLLKRERVNGVMLPESVMKLKVRSKPFSIYLIVESPGDDKGLAVCYVEGSNRGMMRVRPAGIRGILDFWSVDIHDPRARKKNRHCINEAGLGNLLESTARYWEMERRLNATVVHITDDVVDNRSCTRIETIHPNSDAGEFYGYRCLLWLDKTTHLPVGAETYDWPRVGSKQEGELLESYRYLDVRTNVNLSDEVFRH